jgi:hypothetical protein
MEALRAPIPLVGTLRFPTPLSREADLYSHDLCRRGGYGGHGVYEVFEVSPAHTIIQASHVSGAMLTRAMGVWGHRAEGDSVPP